MQSPSMCSFQTFRKLLLVSILFVCLRGQTAGQSFASLQADPASEANLQAHFDKYLHYATRKTKADKALSFFNKQTRSAAQQTNLGIAQATLGKSAKALYHFNQALLREPGADEVLLNRGLYFFGQKKYALAIQDLEAIAGNKAEEAAFWAGMAYLAIKDWETALATLPEESESNAASLAFGKALALYQTGYYQEALEVVNEKPLRTPEARLLRAQCYLFLNQPQKAHYAIATPKHLRFANALSKSVKYVQLGKPVLVGKYFKKAAKLKPHAWEVWFVKAGWAIEQEAFDLALHYLSQAQQKNPASVDIALAIGFVQIQLEDYAGAQDTFAEVLSEDPENLLALDGLGIAHYHQRNFYSVAQLSQNILAMDTLHQLDEGAYLAFAIGCYQTGFYSRADSLISKVFFKNPKSAEAFALRGLWNYKKEHHQAALHNFSAALQYEKKNRSLYNARGNTHFFLGQYGEAIDDFDKVLAAEPDNLEALNGKALCYADLDRYEMATLWYEKALAYYPSEGKLWNNYSVSLTQEGGYYLENGDTSRAKACFDKSQQAIHTARALRPLWKPWCDLNEGNIFHEAGNDSLALIYYAANENAYSLNNTGVVLALHQVYDQAWGYFSLAIQADSTYGVPYANRARLNEFYTPTAGATDKTDRQIAQHLNHLDKRQSPFHRKKYYTIYVFDMDIGYVPDPKPQMYFPPLKIDLMMPLVRIAFAPSALEDYRTPSKIKTFRKPTAKFKSQRYDGFKCPVALKK